MSEARLSFCVVRRLQDDISEVIVDEGVEIDDAMVNEYHDHLLRTHQGPFALLINKKNHYAYSFSAQRDIATLHNVKAMAVLVYTKSAEIATQALLSVKRDIEWNLKIFYDYEEALQWLKDELQVSSA